MDDPFADIAGSPENREPASRQRAPLVTATTYEWRDPAGIPRRPWIYGRQIMRGQVGGKFAPGGAGKTTHEVGVALSMITGRDLLGVKVWGGPKRVWLWNLEDSTEELSRAIQAACKHWNLSAADLGGRLFVDSALDGAILKLATQTSADGVVVNEPIADALLEELRARQIDYLSIDPFISSHSVEENDNGAIDAVVKKYAWIATKANCAVTLTHHVRKDRNGEVSSDHARGASSLVAACRSALVLNRMTPDEATGWGIPGEDRRRFFRVYDDKNNRAPPADKSEWFTLVSVDLGNGAEDGLYPGDSIAVVEPWIPPDAFDDVRVEDLIRVQTLVHSRPPVRENSQATRWVGKLVAEVLELNVNDPGDRKRINKIVRTWIGNGALVVVEKPDNNGDERKFIEVGEWANGAGAAVSSAPQKTEVRAGAEGAGSGRPSAPAPPIYRGAGVRGAAGENQGAGAGADLRHDMMAGAPSPTSTDTPKLGKPRF